MQSADAEVKRGPECAALLPGQEAPASGPPKQNTLWIAALLAENAELRQAWGVLRTSARLTLYLLLLRASV